jgi:hypothetical protein
MRYYLDTVAVRSLRKELPKLKTNSYTSALVILELISGISEKEFDIRKQVIKKLFECRFPIVWKLPETMKADAFSIIEVSEEHRILGLINICNELLRCDDLQTLISKTENEIYNIEFFKDFDTTHSTGFIEATIKGNIELKKIYNEELLNNGSAAEKYAKELVKSLISEVEINGAFTIKGIANYMSTQASSNGEYVSEEEVYNSYNHSINIFVEAFSLFCARKSGELGAPAKNDYLDLNHLLYLRSEPNNYIVTDDKMILEITPHSKSIKEFKEINNIL